MKAIFKKNRLLLLYLIPTLLMCLYFLKVSYHQPLHDFSNSYFSAKLIHDDIAPEKVVFDIYAFNKYIWEQGYENELVDFYINSPFTLAAFYPLAYIPDAYLAKAIFNVISILCLLIALGMLVRMLGREQWWLLLAIPVVFYVPIRNQILFGQSYFIILFLVVTAYYFFLKHRQKGGAGLLSIAILLKFFPLFYGIPLLAQKQWKGILWGVLWCLGLCAIAILITGPDLWEYYFFDVLPHTFRSNTTTDYRFTYQSLDVFFKTLFVKDAYYNPTAIDAGEFLYPFANWVTKAIVVGSAVYGTIKKKNDLFLVLAIWVTTLFLTQSRTATYAQILWIIPLVAVYRLKIRSGVKILFILLVLVICNAPFYKLGTMPIGIQFSRLWVVLLLAVVFYRLTIHRMRWQYILVALVMLFPLHLDMIKAKTEDTSQYVLAEKQHFMIFNFQNDNGNLSYSALGRNGEETITTTIPITTFNKMAVTIKDHQLYFGGQQLTYNRSLKKKPVLVNECEVYFLTDHHSRRAAFTLKKINICEMIHPRL